MKFIDTEKRITIKELDLFTESFNLNLPEEYKKHILKYNGGYPEDNYFQGKGINYFHSIKYGEYGSLEDTLKRISDVLPDNFFPFAYDEGGNQFCISLRKEDYGKIYFCPMDMGEVVPELLVSSFEDFMSQLTDNEDY
ncbi:SMI1/KNR4 family protein [Tenacibaculum aiptasiae]|uniref:SMI1/KNR4 family protein n=1 Tax=Tenacibaculum aiptasiae TaxID=426481 RepID=A0A7J5AMT7_9FLAO|nr:SMI1/KNR4 family protein [Tenacibaculum aiptasiae]KAB1158919.1 SMI1/KNR4 family protein [Tenacibaculum aiptasiae]